MMLEMLICVVVSFGLFSAQCHIYWRAQESNNSSDNLVYQFRSWLKNGSLSHSNSWSGYKLSSASVLCAGCSAWPRGLLPAVGSLHSVCDPEHFSIYSNTSSAGGDNRHAEPKLKVKYKRTKKEKIVKRQLNNEASRMETKSRGYFLMTLCFFLGLATGHISYPLMQCSPFQSEDEVKCGFGFFLFVGRSSRVHFFPLKPNLWYKTYQVTDHQRKYRGVKNLRGLSLDLSFSLPVWPLGHVTHRYSVSFLS